MTDSFLFYKSWYDIIIKGYQSKSDQDILFRAIIDYGMTGEKTYPMERMFLEQAYFQIDSAKIKWDDIRQKRSEAGRKGGQNGKGVTRNLGNQNAKQKQTKANNNKQNHNVNVNDNVNDNIPSSEESKRLSSKVGEYEEENPFGEEPEVVFAKWRAENGNKL